MARLVPSFTDDVKAELANLQPARLCCQHAELQAIVQMLSSRRTADGVDLRIPRNAVARKVVQLAKATGAAVEGVGKGSTERRPTYRLRLRLQPSQASADVCCARAALRGAFLARGAVGDPGNGYHLEIALAAQQDQAVAASLRRLQLPARRLTRRGRAVYYLKGAEPISRALSAIGANRAVMRFENDRIVREMRSQANRRVNGETANLDKRLRAALTQVDHIHRLQARDPRLRNLPAALRDAAELRLAHPQAALAELAVAARVSKSAIANRLRRLMRLTARNGLID